MSDKIIIHQMLHGYRQGHKKIASSIDLSIRSQKTIDILSDLSGSNLENNFKSYITGYPLIDEKVYVLAKTWYAEEMSRPGCVWTHSLLINNDDIKKIRCIKSISKLFLRPNNNNINLYDNLISINIDDRLEHEIKNFDKKKYQYIVYTMLSNDKNTLIESVSSEEYEEIIGDIWIQQNGEFYKNFSFCTGSFSNRKLEKKDFDFQVTTYGLASKLCRVITDAILYKDINDIQSFPNWVSAITEDMLQDNLKIYNEFRRAYGNKYGERKYFNKFAKLYYAFDIKNNNANFTKYINSISQVFKEEYLSIINITMELLCNSTNVKWFKGKQLNELFLDLAKSEEYDINIITSSKILKETADILLMNYKQDIYYYLYAFIHEKLNGFGENLIYEIVENLKPNDLAVVSKMNLNICIILIKLNANLIVSRDIWNQSEKFQLEVLSELNTRDEMFNRVEFIDVIIRYSKFNITNVAYRILGDDLILDIWEWCIENNDFSLEQLTKWISILKLNPILCINNLNKIDNKSFVLLMLNEIDSYEDNLRDVNKETWIKIFRDNNFAFIEYKIKRKIAMFYLPIILKSVNMFPDDIIGFSFGIINCELAEDSINYSEWEKIRKVLPELPLLISWDKCKRLRKAFKNKGYDIKKYYKK